MPRPRSPIFEEPVSKEFKVVQLGARAELSEQRALAFRSVTEDSPDWAEVLRLASYHKTLPLLYVHLRDHSTPPEGVLEALRDRARRVSARILFLSSEMARISRQLREESIPYLVLKGPSLSEAYGDIARRPFVDNDLLVRREDFPSIERVLLDLGFNERKRTDWQQSGYLAVHGEYTFGRAVSGLVSTVDVHTRLVHAGYVYSPSVDHLLSRSRDLTIAGATVQALCWDDLFLALCVNALKDQWDRLRLVSDLAELADYVQDWPALLESAARARVLRTVHLGVLLAADLLDGTFPEDVLASARRDSRAVALSRSVAMAMVVGKEGDIPSGLDRVKLNLMVQDGIRGQLRYTGYAAMRRVTERWVAPQS